MSNTPLMTCIAVGLLQWMAASPVAAEGQPYAAGRFQGRIALSHDGNYNDEDDWGAFPVIIAMLDAFGVKDKLVHIDYNNITNYNDPRFESEMTTSVLGAAEKYGLPSSILKNCRIDVAGAIRSLTAAVNAASADNPLWYLVAGPMDVPYAGIRAADPAKRQFVYCLSHSVWNDGFGRKRPIEGYTKRDVIGLGINWIQVRPGNLLAPSTRTSSTPKQWALFQWMRDSSDERLRWVYSRIQAVGRADVSDATIAYSLLTGDEAGDPQKLEQLMGKKQKPAPVGVRQTIRMEAENFSVLENAAAVLVGKAASQALSVRAAGATKGAIRNQFHEIYTPPSGRYDVDVQYRGETGGATFALRVNGVQQGASWKASADDNAWKTQTFESVALAAGDEIAVEITPEGGGSGEVDFVQLSYRESGQTSAKPRPMAVKSGAAKRAKAAASTETTTPFDGKTFRGRIAYSADGNHNDPDDWIASPVTLAILAESGLKERLVHFDYNCILPLTDPEWEKTHAESVLGAVERYGFNQSVFFDDRKQLDAAVASIAKAINESSADNPLYFIIAGPMEVPYRGIQKSEPAKRQFVYCISHSRWNDGFASDYKFTFTKRSVIEQDVHWIQVQDQNRLLSYGRYGRPSPPEEFKPYFWMRDSRDPKVKFLWDRMVVSTRPDPSDAGMTWFLVTGDEECDPPKLKRLLGEHQPPTAVAARKQVRLEAENFRQVEGFVLEDRSDRNVSHRLNITLAEGGNIGRIRTRFDQPYTASSARYDVEVRFMAGRGGGSQLALSVNGVPQGQTWRTSASDQGWQSHTVADVPIRVGGEVAVEVQAEGGERVKLDYVQLNARQPAAKASRTSAAPVSGSRFVASGPLDDPAAMPGQIIMDPSNPRWLKKNGGERVFLFGSGNPEEFFFFGTRQADGTRAGGNQGAMIKRLVGTGANTFHVLAMRDSRYNIEPGNGAPDCNPFENADISAKLDEDILNQWEGWLAELEAADINVLFTFYNDFDDFEDKAGWKLDAGGNLHPQENYFIETLVNRFKHHKNLIWVIEESCNKLSRAKQQRLIKVAELVAKTDEFHHPIAQMFQILYYDEVHPDKVSPEDYLNTPVKMMTWGHYATPKKGLPTTEQYYRELVGHWQEAAGRYVLLNTEVDKHPSTGAPSRLYCWTSAMANFYTVINSHRPDKANVPRATYLDDGRIRTFMEGTDFHRMSPRSELKHGSTLYVLANAPDSYIAYSPDASANMGLRKLPTGTYRLRWFDTTNGNTVEQTVSVAAGDQSWCKPPGIGNEAALYVKRLSGASGSGLK